MAVPVPSEWACCGGTEPLEPLYYDTLFKNTDKGRVASADEVYAKGGSGRWYWNAVPRGSFHDIALRCSQEEGLEVCKCNPSASNIALLLGEKSVNEKVPLPASAPLRCLVRIHSEMFAVTACPPHGERLRPTTWPNISVLSTTGLRYGSKCALLRSNNIQKEGSVTTLHAVTSLCTEALMLDATTQGLSLSDALPRLLSTLCSQPTMWDVLSEQSHTMSNPIPSVILKQAAVTAPAAFISALCSSLGITLEDHVPYVSESSIVVTTVPVVRAFAGDSKIMGVFKLPKCKKARLKAFAKRLKQRPRKDRTRERKFKKKGAGKGQKKLRKGLISAWTEKKRIFAALVLQRFIRCICSSRRVRYLKGVRVRKEGEEIERSIYDSENIAAENVQRMWRGSKGRVSAKTRHVAVVTIQSWQRALKASLPFMTLATEERKTRLHLLRNLKLSITQLKEKMTSSLMRMRQFITFKEAEQRRRIVRHETEQSRVLDVICDKWQREVTAITAACPVVVDDEKSQRAAILFSERKERKHALSVEMHAAKRANNRKLALLMTTAKPFLSSYKHLKAFEEFCIPVTYPEGLSLVAYLCGGHLDVLAAILIPESKEQDSRADAQSVQTELLSQFDSEVVTSPLAKKKAQLQCKRRVINRELRSQTYVERVQSPTRGDGEWQLGPLGELLFSGSLDPLEPAASPCSDVQQKDLQTWQLLDTTNLTSLQMVRSEVVTEVQSKEQSSYFLGAVAGQSSLVTDMITDKWSVIGGDAALKLQTRWRGHHARVRYPIKALAASRLQQMQENTYNEDRNVAAVFIQRIVRGRQAQAYAVRYRREVTEGNLILSRMGRAYFSRRFMGHEYAILLKYCLLIQEWWRGKLGIARALAELQERKRRQLRVVMEREAWERRRRWKAAVEIQDFYKAVLRRRYLVSCERVQMEMHRRLKGKLFELGPLDFTKRKVCRIRTSGKARRTEQTKKTKMTLAQRVLQNSKQRMKVTRSALLKLCRSELSDDQAVTLIQAKWRGKSDRKKTMLVKQEQEKAAKAIQANWRGVNKRRQGRERRKKRITKSACIVQAVFKGWRQRKAFKNMLLVNRLERRLEMRVAASNTISRVFRGHLVRREYTEMLQRKLALHYVAMEDTAIMMLQRWYRGWQARQSVKRQMSAAHAIQVMFRYHTYHKAFKQTWCTYVAKVSTTQRHVKCRYSRKEQARLHAARNEARELRTALEQQNYSATDIQKMVRGHLTRVSLENEKRRKLFEHVNHMASIIQTRWRAYKMQKWYTAFIVRAREAVTTISAFWKGHMERKRFHKKIDGRNYAKGMLRRCCRGLFVRLLVSEQYHTRKLFNAVTMLQETGRAMKGRRKVQKLSEGPIKNAIKIQSAWRGRLTRKWARILILQRRIALKLMQRVWLGAVTRSVVRPLLRQRQVIWKEKQAWEDKILRMLIQESHVTMTEEGVSRGDVEDVETEEKLSLVAEHETIKGKVAAKMRIKQERLNQCNMTARHEIDLMYAIDLELQAEWKKTYTAFVSKQAQERNTAENDALSRRAKIEEEEEDARQQIVVLAPASVKEMHIKTGQRVWEEKRIAHQKRLQHELEEREALMTRHEKKRNSWKERYMATKKEAYQLVLKEKLRRKDLTPEERCNEFQGNYISRRLKQAQRRDSANSTMQQLNSHVPPAKPMLPAIESKPLLPTEDVVSVKTFAQEWIKTTHPASFRNKKKIYIVPGESLRGRLQEVIPRVLSNDPATEHMDLSKSSLTDIHMHSLLGAFNASTTCKTVNLDENDIGDTAVKELADVLVSHRSITSVSLCKNSFTDAGVRCLVHAVKGNRKLCRVNVTNNFRVSENAIIELESALSLNLRIVQNRHSVFSKRTSIAAVI